MSSFRDLLAGIPNVPDDVSVPVGRSAEDNVEVRRVGTAARISISNRSRIGIWVAELGILDLERAAKITGARFALYWDHGRQAGTRTVLTSCSMYTQANTAYTEVLPPVLVNSRESIWNRKSPEIRSADLFKLREARNCSSLAPTSEVPITNILSQRNSR